MSFIRLRPGKSGASMQGHHSFFTELGTPFTSCSRYISKVSSGRKGWGEPLHQSAEVR